MNQQQGTNLPAQQAECLPVRFGCGRQALDKPMTAKQARRWGRLNMPGDLKRSGFEVVVFRSDPEIHFGDYFRVSFGKKLCHNGRTF